MAKIVQRGTMDVSAAFTVDEEEMRALDAMVGYGYGSFIETFRKHLGESYMRGHEDGLKRFFESIGGQVAPILRRADDARAVFEGQKVASRPPQAA
jgi:hypothetical protein